MNIEMRANPDPKHGDVAKSVACFRITGRGVHNRYHPHELIRWDFTGTEFEGKNGNENGLRFSARPIAITAWPEDRPPTYDIAIGDVVTVDGEDYVVTARALADPELVPISLKSGEPRTPASPARGRGPAMG